MLDRLSDRRLATLLGLVLFVGAAWPLPFVDVPPYQDLPGHLAAVSILQHLDRYPEYAPAGLLKTNAAFFAFCLAVAPVAGVVRAGKLFVVLVLGAGAFVLPRFVLHFAPSCVPFGPSARLRRDLSSGVPFGPSARLRRDLSSGVPFGPSARLRRDLSSGVPFGPSARLRRDLRGAPFGRRRMVVASLAAWPMVHDWFVAMGMLDFALSVPCALVLLVLLDRHDTAPSWPRAAAAAAMAVVTWYAHVFAVLVVGLMACVHVAASDRRVARARRLLPPLLPAGALAASSVVGHVASAGTAASGVVEAASFTPLPWRVYDLWAHWLYGFTPLSASTLVAAAVLVVWLIRGWRGGPPLLGPWPTAALLAGYLACPSFAVDWGYVSARFVPFLWIAALARAPERLSRRLAAVLVLAAAAYWAGNGVDVLRLDREMRELTAGTDAVPDGARVAFLVFSTRLTSRNTWSLATAAAMYAVARHTNAPNVWANSASQPLLRRVPPEPWEDPVLVRRFLDEARDRGSFCRARVPAPLDPGACEDAFHRAWADYWRQAGPRTTHVLMWDPTGDVRAELPASYALAYQRGRLWIWARL